MATVTCVAMFGFFFICANVGAQLVHRNKKKKLFEKPGSSAFPRIIIFLLFCVAASAALSLSRYSTILSGRFDVREWRLKKCFARSRFEKENLFLPILYLRRCSCRHSAFFFVHFWLLWDPRLFLLFIEWRGVDQCSVSSYGFLEWIIKTSVGSWNKGRIITGVKNNTTQRNTLATRICLTKNTLAVFLSKLPMTTSIDLHFLLLLLLPIACLRMRILFSWKEVYLRLDKGWCMASRGMVVCGRTKQIGQRQETKKGCWPVDPPGCEKKGTAVLHSMLPDKKKLRLALGRVSM